MVTGQVSKPRTKKEERRGAARDWNIKGKLLVAEKVGGLIFVFLVVTTFLKTKKNSLTPED